jgi:ABC-type multidrug transport system ATPase subunit
MSFIESTKKVAITWKNVNAYAKDKAILNNCEGYCQAGQMLAIMGPSGAGKTSLLSILSKKNNPSLNITGSVLLLLNLDFGQH